MISAILLSLAIGAALGAVAMSLYRDHEREHLLTENNSTFEAMQATATDYQRIRGEYERLRAITEQPEGACVQLVQIGNASTLLGRPI